MYSLVEAPYYGIRLYLSQRIEQSGGVGRNTEEMQSLLHCVEFRMSHQDCWLIRPPGESEQTATTEFRQNH